MMDDTGIDVVEINVYGFPTRVCSLLRTCGNETLRFHKDVFPLLQVGRYCAFWERGFHS